MVIRICFFFYKGIKFFRVLLNKNHKAICDKSKYNNDGDKQLVRESLDRWFTEDFATNLFSKQLKQLGYEWLELKAHIEELFVDIERYKWYYFNNYNKKAIIDWKITIEFIAYLTNQLNWNNYEKIAKSLSFEDKDIKKWKDFSKNMASMSYKWSLKMEDFNKLDINNIEVERIRKIRRFRPWSKDAQILFSIACKIAKLPDWSNNKNLHKIMWKESTWWQVGILNYTIKWMSTYDFKQKALSSSRKNPIGSKSTASWLWQLLLSNVDRLYPSWRNGIWNPIEEAIGFVKYIRERYGNPDIAMSVYWKKWSYTNSRTWRKQSKTFKEGY
jgi:hypothetical protein